MRRTALTFRAVATLAPSLATTLVPTAASAAAGPAVSTEQPFYVDSGDPCPRGYTQGTLVWRTGSGVDHVDAVGEVVDRVDPKDPACGEDGRYTIATFTVYEDGAPHTPERRQADNGILQFSMPVDGNTTEAYFERVIVRVCRVSRLPGPPIQCGIAQEYLSPLRVP